MIHQRGMNSQDPPPPIISSARLLAFVVIPDTQRYTGRICLLVDGKRLERVPCLAICRNYRQPDDILLLFCDEDWNSLGCIGVASVEDGQLQAERDYPGLQSHWVDSPYDDPAIARYLRDELGVDPASEWWAFRCSFCLAECEGMAISQGNATICRRCIDHFHVSIHELDD